jgi:hypothetical protein
LKRAGYTLHESAPILRDFTKSLMHFVVDNEIDADAVEHLHLPLDIWSVIEEFDTDNRRDIGFRPALYELSAVGMDEVRSSTWHADSTRFRSSAISDVTPR